MLCTRSIACTARKVTPDIPGKKQLPVAEQDIKTWTYGLDGVGDVGGLRSEYCNTRKAVICSALRLVENFIPYATTLCAVIWKKNHAGNKQE
jgi:hypothetical protein